MEKQVLLQKLSDTGVVAVIRTDGGQELIEICRVVAEHDGLYATHIRNEGYRLLEALEETFEIVKKSGVRTEISHLKASGQPNWGLVKEAVARIYRQRQQG